MRFRIRLDFRGDNKQGKFWFRGKSTRQVAEEVREHQVTLLRHVPLRGLRIEEIDTEPEVYTLGDEGTGEQVSYAPAFLTLQADNLEDILTLVIREEFRQVEVLQPESLELSPPNVERVLFRVAEEMRRYRINLERRAAR